MKWKLKLVLLKVSLMNFILGISKDLHSWDIQRDQMEGESGVTRSIIDKSHSWDIQGDKMKGESGVTRIIIDEHQS